MNTSITMTRGWRIAVATIASIGAIGISNSLTVPCAASPEATVYGEIAATSAERVNNSPTVTVVQAGNGLVAMHIQGDDHNETVEVSPGVYAVRAVPNVRYMPMNWFTGWIQSVAQSVLSWLRWFFHSCWGLVHAFGAWFASNFRVGVTYTDGWNYSAACVTFIDIPVKCNLSANTNGQINLSVTSR